jgi:hypothetical protein
VPGGRSARLGVNLGIAGAVLALVTSIFLQSGRTVESGGLGYDGEMYAIMTSDALYRGGDNPRMRPLVILANQLVFDVAVPDVIRAYQVMNFVYTAALALLLCGILDQYGVSIAHKLVFALNVFATIAVAKMFAFYPVLIDLGAYVFVTLAVYAVLRGRRGPIVLSTTLAVFAREFGLVAILFGIHRDIRLGVRPRVIAATYAPAVVAFASLRQWVMATSTREPTILSGSDVLANLASLADPLFLGFLAYFTATVFGGISLMLLTRALRGRIPLHGETEWLTYLGVIGAMTIVGNADLWRYLAYALPVAAVLYARGFGADDWFLVAPWTGLVTVLTQQPWATMTDLTYFEDWFPLYIARFGVPDDASPPFWTAWAVRMTIVAGLAALVWWAQRRGGVLAPRHAGAPGLAV